MRFFSRASVSRVTPDGFEVCGQIVEVLRARCRGAIVSTLMALDLRFDVAHSVQRLVPSPFELVGDQSVVRVDLVELLLRPLCVVTSGLQVALQRGGHVIELA